MSEQQPHDNARVTWIMPVRNGMPYLPETLASIAAQTGVPARMLAWDNGSTDGTIEELRRWIPSRIPGRVVVDRPQATLAESLALLVRECDTAYCARIDADDICLPDRLSSQLAYLDKNPEVSLVGGQVRYIDPKGNERAHQQRLPTARTDIVHGLLHGCPVCHPTWVFRRDAVLEAGNYDDGRPVREDVDLLIRLISAGKEVACLDRTVLRYRVHPKSFTQTNLRQDPYALVPVQSLALRAENFLGLGRDEVERTLQAKSGFTLRQYFRIARHMETFAAPGACRRLTSTSFLNAMLALCGDEHPVRRALLRALLAQRSRQWDVFRNQMKLAFLGLVRPSKKEGANA